MPPIDFMFGPRPRYGQVIQQNITIRQPGGFLGFMTGLFGGLRGFMPGMYPMGGYCAPYGCGSIFPYGGYSKEQIQFNYYAQQMLMEQQFAQMKQMQNQYAYLNQMQQQPFLMDGDRSKSSAEMQNLDTFFKAKGYVICPEADGKYTVADKNGNLLASGTYAEVRDKLFEINKAEAEKIEDKNDIDDVDSEELDGLDDDEEDDDEVSAPRKQGVPSGWYKSSNDGYKYLKNVDVAAVNKDAKKEGQSAARFIVSHLLLPTRYNGCLNMKQINTLTNTLVACNTECFNKDGSFKEGFSSDKMVIPDSKWIAKNIFKDESMTPSKRLGLVREYMSNTNPYLKTEEEKIKYGNRQYQANLMAQKNCRETCAKDIYYNEKTKTHEYMFYSKDENTKKETIKIVSLSEVKLIVFNKDRTHLIWQDKDNKWHTGENSISEIIKLAEERLERTASPSSTHSSSVPDDDGMSDNTVVFENYDYD